MRLAINCCFCDNVQISNQVIVATTKLPLHSLTDSLRQQEIKCFARTSQLETKNGSQNPSETNLLYVEVDFELSPSHAFSFIILRETIGHRGTLRKNNFDFETLYPSVASFPRCIYHHVVRER